MRRKVIAGNWKMNKSPKDVEEFMERFPGLVSDTENEVILCVPFIDLCKAVNLKTRTETTIVNVLDKRRKTEYTYDEFWIAVKENNEFTSQTCADLYKQFKKEMK